MRFKSVFVGLATILVVIYVAEQFSVKEGGNTNVAEEIRSVAVVQPDIVVHSSKCSTMDLYYVPPAKAGVRQTPQSLPTLKNSVRNSDGSETWKFGIPVKPFDAERVYVACRTATGTMLSHDMATSDPMTLRNMLWPAYPSNARL